MLLQVGMRNSVRTSELLQYRAEYSVPPRTERMIKAIEERDFQTFAELSMKDSNQFHAVCQDTFPPCVYMNQTSHSVSSLVHQLNEHFGEMVACYTFDAGPNACIFLLEKVAPVYCTAGFLTVCCSMWVWWPRSCTTSTRTRQPPASSCTGRSWSWSQGRSC